MDYKPTINDIIFAKKVYDNVIVNQVLNPILVHEAFMRLFGYKAQTAQQAKIKVFAWFNYEFKEEMLTPQIGGMEKSHDKTETAEINQPSVVIDNPSHSEDLTIDFNGKQLTIFNTDLKAEDLQPQESHRGNSLNGDNQPSKKSDLGKRIQELQAEYDKPENEKSRRSLAMKITHLKKKLNQLK